MPDYKKSKVYCIRSYENDDIYVGSTVCTLSVRFSNHKSHMKRGKPYCSSWEVLKHPSAYIELLELCPCDTIEELKQRELHYIREMNCVNKNIPLRDVKQYREDNKEHIKEVRSAYYEANAERLREEAKEYHRTHREEEADYYQKNKERLLQNQREYREKNKEMVLRKQREYRARRKAECSS